MIYLIRHGETVWNEMGRQQGHLDSPLTAKGLAQARAVGRTLRQILQGTRDVVLQSSPLGRARQTALAIGAELGIASEAIGSSALLMELKLGAWEGLTWAEIDRQFPGARQQREADKWTYRIENGESYALARERAKCWLASCAAPLTVAVTHEMMSRSLQGAYASLSPEETLGRSHRHDCICRLHDGKISEFGTDFA